jgi:hypothetical protein
LKRAEVPAPLVKPKEVPPAPPPARVVTHPSGRIKRIMWFPLSATKTWLEALAAALAGPLNSAAVPNPFAKPLEVWEGPPPARVATLPLGATVRTRWLPKSATYTAPLGPTVAA